ncbi:unnamed protein product [Prorocentrum cordatum]|uniref:Uncharacterized protein n=1 Tax=Prorocentrum cordatum TaxID=2364126 RepID=A0ABN9XUQ8_9DINO|nr:unnamed protein product [Polarella glacialis]
MSPLAPSPSVTASPPDLRQALFWQAHPLRGPRWKLARGRPMEDGGGAPSRWDDGEGGDVCLLELRYQAALRALRAEAGLDPEASRRRARELKELSREVRRAKHLLASRGARPAWSSYPQPVELPRCPGDPRFVRSFAVDEPDAAREFFGHFGFVVFHGVLGDADCRATVDEIWAYLERRIANLRRGDPETWGLLSRHKYGLPPAQAIFTEQVRSDGLCSCRCLFLCVYAALDAVLPRLPEGEQLPWVSPHPSPNSVVVSNDRWCLYPPALGDPRRATPASLHLDVNPWSYVSQDRPRISSPCGTRRPLSRRAQATRPSPCRTSAQRSRPSRARGRGSTCRAC